VPEEPCQHRKRMLSQRLIQEGLLSNERFGRTTGRQRIARIKRRFRDLRKQFIDTGQSCRTLFAVRPQRFTQHELARTGVIACVEPKMKTPRLKSHNARQSGAGRARIDAADQKVTIGQVSSTPNVRRQGDPIESPEQIQSLN